MRLLFNETVEEDLLSVLAFIDDFTKSIGLQDVEVEPRLIEHVLRGMRQDFPCIDGLEKAGVFKKVANFILYFVTNQPVVKPFPAEIVGHDLAKIANHQNAIIAFNIAVKALEGAVIHWENTDVSLDNPLMLSQHSYVDIIEAISSSTPAVGYLLLTVLMEQIAYKTNPDCQYEPFAI